MAVFSAFSYNHLLLALFSTITYLYDFRAQTIEAARAESEKIKQLGLAEAHAIKLVGKAEAERMKMKATVYKQYGDAAIMNIVLESLPKVNNDN